jgi:hypothetical protein
MRSSSIVGFASFLGLASLFAGGCTPVRLGDDSSGDLGNARFEYQSSDCFFGCSLDRPALEGSKVTIIARGGDVEKRPTARLATGATGVIAAQSESCSCDRSTNDSSESRSIDPSAKCSAGETKSCQLAVDIETSKEGDDTLEIHEANGDLRDKVVFHVRLASKIELSVKVDDQDASPKDGVYEVKRGSRIALASKVLASDGQQMIFTEHGVGHEYADRTVIQPDEKVIFGATDVEDMVTGRAGETSITVTAPGAEAIARFRVVE